MALHRAGQSWSLESRLSRLASSGSSSLGAYRRTTRGGMPSSRAPGRDCGAVAAENLGVLVHTSCSSLKYYELRRAAQGWRACPLKSKLSLGSPRSAARVRRWPKRFLALRLRIEQVAEAATLEPELGSPSQSSARVHNGEGERHDIIL